MESRFQTALQPVRLFPSGQKSTFATGWSLGFHVRVCSRDPPQRTAPNQPPPAPQRPRRSACTPLRVTARLPHRERPTRGCLALASSPATWPLRRQGHSLNELLGSTYPRARFGGDLNFDTGAQALLRGGGQLSLACPLLQAWVSAWSGWDKNSKRVSRGQRAPSEAMSSGPTELLERPPVSPP